MHHADLRDALQALGELLATRTQHYDIVVIGGGALLLLGLIDRPTRDFDIVSRIDGGKWLEGEPMPVPLATAIEEVGRALDLDDDWLNAGPTDLLRFGLPLGFAERVVSHQYAGLTVRLA